jgi:hypothetical protein
VENLLPYLLVDNEQSSPMLSLILLVLTVLGAILTFGKDTVQFLQARVKQPGVQDQATLRALQLRTARASKSMEKQRRDYKAGLYTNLVVGTLLALLPSNRLIDKSPLDWADAVVFSYGLFMIAYSGSKLLSIRKVPLDRPLVRRKASVVVEGQLDEVATRCQRALADLQAITVEETRIETGNPIRVMFQGGTRGWPPKGQRVTIKVRRVSGNQCYILIESAAFFPGMKNDRKNSYNVLTVLRHLV